jgi:multidrug efflux pump subunit AcrA (membrane-fusion protein)
MRVVWPVLTVVVMVVTLTGCTNVPLDVGGAPPAPSEVAPAVVTRADVVSVLTVDAVIVATPTFAVLAERDGVVRHVGIEPGAQINAGQAVATQDGEELRAPVDGFYVGREVPDGVFVHAGVTVALLRYAGFGATATVPPDAAYRLYGDPSGARLQVTGGPGPTGCVLLPVAATADDMDPGPATTDGQMSMLCAVPAGLRLIDGSVGVLALTTAERRQVLTLPAQAVAGTAGRGSVLRMVDGELVPVEVTLGVTDGVRVEILAGLDEGDQVWPYGPHLRPVLPGRG